MASEGLSQKLPFGLTLSDEKPDVAGFWEQAIEKAGWEGGSDMCKGLELRLEGRKSRETGAQSTRESIQRWQQRGRQDQTTCAFQPWEGLASLPTACGIPWSLRSRGVTLNIDSTQVF